MSKLAFRLLYVIFVVSVLLYSAFHIGGIVTPKQLMALVMFFVCMKIDKGVETNKYLSIYFVFVLSFGVSSFVSGYPIDFINQLIGTYFVAYVAFWSTKILVAKYSGIRFFVNTLLFVGVMDAFITICQSYQIGIGDTILSFLRLNNSLNYLEEMNSETRDFLELVLPGMFSSGVYNGYFLMSVGVLSLSLVFNRKYLLGIGLWVIFVVSSFMAQQRGPFYILIVISFFTFIKIFNSSQNRYLRFVFVSIFLLLSLISIRFSYQKFNSIESRMSSLGLTDTGRSDIYSTIWAFYQQHPFLGGYFSLVNEYHVAPHNLFLNAYIYGGFVGGSAIVYLVVSQFSTIIRVIRRRINNANPYLFFVAMCFIAFTANSLLHNKSIVTGDCLLWEFWAVIYVYCNNLKYENLYSRSRLSN